MHSSSTNRGFTLVEMLVGTAIGLIAVVLAGMLMQEFLRTDRVLKDMAERDQIRNRIRAYCSM